MVNPLMIFIATLSTMGWMTVMISLEFLVKVEHVHCGRGVVGSAW